MGAQTKQYYILAKETFFNIAIALALLFAISCNKSDEDEVLADEILVGLITVREFEAVPFPSFESYKVAYEAVTDMNPELLGDEELLTREIFDVIAANNTTSKKAKSSQRGILDTADGLNREEWISVLRNPIDAFISFFTVGASESTATSNFPCDSDIKFDGGKADALRHAFWNVLMARRANTEFAEEFATAHESEVSNAERAKAMDLHNNEFGRNLEKQFPEATEEQLLELLLQQNYEFVDADEDFPDMIDRLVFINGKREFDDVFTGFLTNPDSGGPWEMKLLLNQCDEVVRGQFEITRGQEFQARRFSGMKNGDNFILNVSNPYLFENPNGIQACVNMQIVLSFENGLNGSWTASNCPLGGQVGVNR